MSVADRFEGVDWARTLALLAVFVTLGASLQVMYHFIDVVGLPIQFLAVVAVSLLAATLLARVLRPWLAVLLGGILLAAGLGWYLTHLTNPPWMALLADTLSLFGGRSLLLISSIRAWVLGVAPAPVFLAWYFAVRRWYTPAIAVAGGTLTFFVLTGDADVTTTVTGVVAAAAALGLGDIDRRDESIAHAESILVLVSVMIIVPMVVSVVPATAGAVGPLAPELDQSDTVEANLLNADEEIAIQGEISLSPAVRFTVTSPEPRYWRVGSYDRYTGDGWIRTDGTRPYQGNQLKRPPGPNRTVEQTYQVKSATNAMPAAWKPIRAWGVDSAQVRSGGSFTPGETLESGTSYRVRSQVPDAEPEQLQTAGTDYPDAIATDYTQLPESTPDRVGQRTERLTANADSPYETARVIEQYLENNKNYSLDVDRPRGDVADAFLFEMDAGYCTYYATTMVTMLRTQDIPVRFVVGYSPGERVDEDRWTVRGMNSHAWVEVYFPDYGWIQFDPTPSGPRDAARDRRVQQARENNVSSVDTRDSRESGEWSPTPTRTPEPLTTTDGSNDSNAGPSGTNETPTRPGGIITRDIGQGNATASDGDDESFLPRLPTRQQLALGLVALVGAVVGVRRSKVGERAYRAVWLRYQPRKDPVTDVERAFNRLEYHLGRKHYRPRWADETVREYVDAVGANRPARRVAEIRERARYRGEVSEAEADEAVRLVDELVR